jgi:hypothetical protein
VSDDASWNRIRFDPSDPRGHVESFFVKANDVAGERALWVRYTILAPARKPAGLLGRVLGGRGPASVGAVLEVWAVAFERARGAPLWAKERHPIGAAAIDPSGPRIEVGGSVFEPGRARGRARSEDGAVDVAWDLRWSRDAPPLALLPSRLLYETPFPSSKVVSPVPDASFAGFFEATDAREARPARRFEVLGWPGMQGHNWGRRHALRYAWVHGNSFAGAPGAVFEAASGSVPLGPLASPLLTTAVLRIDGRELDFRAPSRWRNPTAEIDAAGGRLAYRVGLESETARVIAHVEAEDAEAAHLPYEDPDGAIALCRNAKLARMTLEVATRAGPRGSFSPWRRLEGPGALEVLGAIQLAGVGSGEGAG